MVSASAPEYLTPLFLSLHVVGGFVGLPIVVLTFLISKKISKHPLLINFCVTWIVYSIVYTLLVLSGQRKQPPRDLCLAQACLIQGAPPMCAVAGFGIALYLWCKLNRFNLHLCDKLQLALSIIPPYITYIIFVAVAAVLGLRDRTVVTTENQLYCTIDSVLSRYLIPSLCALLVLLILGLSANVLLAVYFTSRKAEGAFPLANRDRSSSFSVRLFIFIFFSVLTLGACVYLLFVGRGVMSILVQALLPFATFLVFGTQKETFIAWGLVRPEDGMISTSDDARITAESLKSWEQYSVGV